MVMHSGKTEFNPTRSPMLQAVQQLDATKELIRSSKEADFITLLDFMDPGEATDFAACIYKCRKHNLPLQEQRFWLIAKARVAVKGQRADKYSMTLARLIVPEAYGGHSASGNGHNGNGKEPANA